MKRGRLRRLRRQVTDLALRTGTADPRREEDDEFGSPALEVVLEMAGWEILGWTLNREGHAPDDPPPFDIREWLRGAEPEIPGSSPPLRRVNCWPKGATP
jgi:hypothetical protein